MTGKLLSTTLRTGSIEEIGLEERANSSPGKGVA